MTQHSAAIAYWAAAFVNRMSRGRKKRSMNRAGDSSQPIPLVQLLHCPRALEQPLRQPDVSSAEQQLTCHQQDQQPHQYGYAGNIADHRQNHDQSCQKQQGTEGSASHHLQNRIERNRVAFGRSFADPLQKFLEILVAYLCSRVESQKITESFRSASGRPIPGPLDGDPKRRTHRSKPHQRNSQNRPAMV